MERLPCVDVLFQNKFLFNIYGEAAETIEVSKILDMVTQRMCIPEEAIFLTCNGHIVTGDVVSYVECDVIRARLRLRGGKGGFGSMLRAIGAQIEKTTNREACRDLSGRRLRDINEERRLRNWLGRQGERDKEAAERKKARLERLCAEPTASGTFADASYDAERAALPERIEDAIEAGIQACASRSGPSRASPSQPEGAKDGEDTVAVKRPAPGNTSNGKNKKKPKLWIDADLPDCSSDSESEAEAEKVAA